MKFDLDFMQRGYYANLLRIRAAQQRKLADQRSMSVTQQELRDEAGWCESEALRLDEAREPVTVSDKEPIRVDARRDIDNVDPPQQKEVTHGE